MIRTWQERLAGLALALAAGCVGWFGRNLPLSRQVLLWGMLLIALAVLLRRGWLKLFGPVLFYDLIRVARRGRYVLLRTLYAGFLFLLLCQVYATWMPQLWQAPAMQARMMAQFAESFFATFMAVQFLLVVLLTPAYTAGAIAEEKERKTLEFILATDLRNREIVLGKLAARLANLTLLVLTGLPILSFLQFLGGVDPDLVLAGFAATGMTMLSLASLSIFNSVLVRKTRDAIVFTYLEFAAYLAVSGLSWLALIPDFGLANLPSTDWWTSPITVTDLVYGINSGNLVAALIRLFGVTRMDEIAVMLRNYAIFHGLVALLFASWAVWRLRVIALRQASGGDVKKDAKGGILVHLRPAVGDRPVVWKELHVESSLRYTWIHRVVLGVLVLASFVPFVMIMYFWIAYTWQRNASNAWDQLGWSTNVWVRIVGTMVACLTLLGVAVRASGSISGERDRQTLDALLTSPLDTDSILYGKWLGSILSVRWGWLWMGTIVGLGVITTGVHILALPLLLVAWFCYAAFLAGLGLWYSTVSRTTLRANVYTILTAFSFAFAHWLIWTCCIPLFFFLGSNGPGRDIQYVTMFQAFGLTPPLTLGFLAFHGGEFERVSYRNHDEAMIMLSFALIGLVLYAVGAGLLWMVTSNRFRELTGRTPQRRRPTVPPPERETIPEVEAVDE